MTSTSTSTTTTTTTMSTIPTGDYRQTRLCITTITVEYSYGRKKSPVTEDDTSGSIVWTDGEPRISTFYGITTYFYGNSPYTRYDDFVHYVYPGGVVGSFNVFSNSYGIYSLKLFTPNSRVDYTDYIILPDGSSNDYYVYLVYSSYGINRQNKWHHILSIQYMMYFNFFYSLTRPRPSMSSLYFILSIVLSIILVIVYDYSYTIYGI